MTTFLIKNVTLKKLSGPRRKKQYLSQIIVDKITCLQIILNVSLGLGEITQQTPLCVWVAQTT